MMLSDRLSMGIEFQSTRPGRGATAMRLFYLCISLIALDAARAGRDIVIPDVKKLIYDFNPRAPCGARPTEYCQRLT